MHDMTITARFSSICPNCRQPISVGERVEWSRGHAAQHVTCQPAARPQMSEDDPEFGREDPRSPHYRRSCRQPETCPLHGTRTAKARKFADVGTDNDDRSYDAWIEFVSNECNEDRHDHGYCRDHYSPAETARLARLVRGSGLESGGGPSHDSPRRDYPDPVIADDDEQNPIPLEVSRAERLLERKGFHRSRWSRPDDDELESAAY
jgi:hypothetical protein